MKAAVSWSGGKESALACYKAISSGLDVVCLINMVTEKSVAHGKPRTIALQSEAVGIPIIQKETSWGNYERDFKKVLNGLKENGVTHAVFGDIDMQEHKDWTDRVCSECRITPLSPLWKKDRMEILTEFIEKGFDATILCTKADMLGEEWLGRKIDRKFVQDMRNLKPNVDLCGELGEYHTFVTNGPFFQKPIRIRAGVKQLKNGYWFLDITEYKLG